MNLKSLIFLFKVNSVVPLEVLQTHIHRFPHLLKARDSYVLGTFQASQMKSELVLIFYLRFQRQMSIAFVCNADYSITNISLLLIKTALGNL